MPVIGIIGGSGIYKLDGLQNSEWVSVDSSFGETSDKFLIGNFGGTKTIFVPRHGRGHKLLPSNINYRANIDALKRLGVTDIISLSAVGSLSEDISPGSFVIIDQFIDRTFAREKTFFDNGLVGHVSIADPVCSLIGNIIEDEASSISTKVIRNGTYIVMEGPQFSSRAESELYRSWGCSVIGMTNMPEAKLAREAEICYSTIAMVTDFDCWHPSHDNVDVPSVLKILEENIENAKILLEQVIPRISKEKNNLCSFGCQNSLDNSIMTSKSEFSSSLVKKLQAVAGRVL